ncbi:MAG: hypothetical protein E6Q50_15645 [Lysobacter sp.]|nr:MAG: hypothetical protein E6Q50_15645 [Lysobacter sp.]
MILVRHRRNTAEDLRATPVEYGVELDLRSYGDRLIVHHDAFVDGEDFERWLDAYRHRLLILNVKEEGLEQRLIALMRERGIEDWFFLDQSFPFLIRTARMGESRCAVRVSEFESIDTALTLAGQVDWVWVDCFTRFPLDRAQAERLRGAGFKLCLVSPELQGREAATEIPALRALLAREGIVADAVCTKEPALWR